VYGRKHAAQYANAIAPYAGYRDWHQVLDPDIIWQFDEATHAIHLWNEMWRRNQQDKNHRYHPDCLYEQLKRKYLG
jgi:hypothetical protein